MTKVTGLEPFLLKTEHTVCGVVPGGPNLYLVSQIKIVILIWSLTIRVKREEVFVSTPSGRNSTH